jgi:addiction module RelE/StbE family toxin
MAAKVSWPDAALRDLAEIISFIAKDSPNYAEVVFEKIIAATQRLENHSLMGNTVPEFEDSNIRELHIYSYRIIYRLESDMVVIGTVIHGKRLLNSLQ